jgi:hypothetical protein
METMKKQINSTNLFWGVYVAFLFVLFPQAAWTIGQFQDVDGGQWSFLGVQASPLAWLLAGVFEITIGIVTHRLNQHWMEMPKRYKADGMAGRRFSYRWLNVYAATLLTAMIVSAIANYTHVVEFTNRNLQVFLTAPWSVRFYQVVFGMALPLVSFVFARALSTMQEGEYEDDPAFARAKADLREANVTIRSLEQSIRLSEQRANDAEQRYFAVGDVIRWLFGKDDSLRDRIRGIRRTFPALSQNGIAQILQCSVSTVNDALSGFQVEIPEMIEVEN